MRLRNLANRKWHGITGRDLVVFCMAMVWGLLAHGFMLSHKLSFHDDAEELFLAGNTYMEGRWFLGILSRLLRLIFGGSDYSLPWANGLLCLALLAVMTCFLVRLFDLRHPVSWALLAGAAVCIPSVTQLMGFMFTAHYYALAMLMAVYGVGLVCREEHWLLHAVPGGKKARSGSVEGRGSCAAAGSAASGALPVTAVSSVSSEQSGSSEADRSAADCRKENRRRVGKMLAGVVMVILAMGIYQSVLSLSCCVLLLFLLKEVWQGGMTKRGFWQVVLLDLVFTIVETVLYLAAMYAFSAAVHVPLGDYAGVSTAGQEGLGVYLQRLVLAYQTFFAPDAKSVYTVYPMGGLWMHAVLLVLAGLLTLVAVGKLWRGEGGAYSAAAYCFLLVLLPGAEHLIFVMTELKWVHAITLYAEVMTVLYVVLLLEWLGLPSIKCVREQREPGEGIAALHVTGSHQIGGSGLRSWVRLLRVAAAALLTLLCVGWVRYSNLCYLKAELLQAEAVSYFDRLITRIQSTPGYRPDMLVVYLNEQNKAEEDASLASFAEFDGVVTPPYQYPTLINDYSWKTFMKIWNGFDPQVYPETPGASELPDVKAMPRYPAEGSIVVREGSYIVVKF